MNPAKKDGLWRAMMRAGHVMGCHQMPERSFHTRHYQFPLCARCTGLLFGQTAGWAAIFLGIRLPPWVGAALLFPMAVDGGIQLIGLLPSTNPRRLVTGLAGGFGMAFLVAQLIRVLLRLLHLPPLF